MNVRRPVNLNRYVTIAALFLCGCSPAPVAPPVPDNPDDLIQVGGLYAGRTPEGHYRITKVLAVDDLGPYLRDYSNEFPELPTADDLSDLETLGDYGLARGVFFDNSPQLITVEAVTPEELASYRLNR